MAEDRSTIILPEGNQYPGYAYPVMGGFGNGFGSFNSIADLFGLAIIASMFGWGNNGFGGFGGWGGGKLHPVDKSSSRVIAVFLRGAFFVYGQI